jgi:hypothetical protein
MSNDIERARDALQAIEPACDRPTWVKAGMAAHAAGLGFEDFDAWSKPAGNYVASDSLATWRSFKTAPAGVGAATLFHLARAAGWVEGDATSRPAPAIRRAIPTRKPTQAPADLWSSCKPATNAHPYIQAKRAAGVPLDGLRVVPAGDPLRVAGQSVAGWLVVPAYAPDGTLQSAQLTPPPGKAKKLNLPGCPMAGASFTVGRGTGPVYLCEGIGQAWAVWQASGHRAVCCFGWGNVASVAASLRQQDEAARLVLVPDVGKEPQAAEIAAAVSGAVAAMPIGWPKNSDVADLAQRDGLDALELLLEAAVISQASSEMIDKQIAALGPKPSTPRMSATPLLDRAEDLQPVATDQATENLKHFYAYLPTHQYLFAPTRELWPAASVNSRIFPNPRLDGKKVSASVWLDRKRAVEQMIWDPDQGLIVKDRVMQISGYASHHGASLFNLYRPPEAHSGDPDKAGKWLDHLQKIYPNDAAHIENYFAFKLQYPGVKINHAIVMGGAQGIGKDTLLAPVVIGIGPWNCQDITPVQMLGRFNGWAKTVLLRINEARDLGDVDRFAFYDHSKVVLAAPPDVIRVDEKNLREHYVVNVCGVVITTNHKSDGLYVPADDRRHYVAWSESSREEFDPEYWNNFYHWYACGGTGHVIAYLRRKNLSSFDPKAPPPKTPAFWSIVQANESPESGELRDVIDSLGNPEALTLETLIGGAQELKLGQLYDELRDRKFRRSMPYKLERVGYVPVRNPGADDGLFKIRGRRQAVYGLKSLPLAEQIKSAKFFV